MASRRHIRKNACTYKVRYQTAPLAWKAVFDGMKAYRCRFCGGYHIGHPKRRR